MQGLKKASQAKPSQAKPSKWSPWRASASWKPPPEQCGAWKGGSQSRIGLEKCLGSGSTAPGDCEGDGGGGGPQTTERSEHVRAWGADGLLGRGKFKVPWGLWEELFSRERTLRVGRETAALGETEAGGESHGQERSEVTEWSRSPEECGEKRPQGSPGEQQASFLPGEPSEY